ncbi:MAG: mechanosensitive ion channel family protein, partial [Anaerolineales bacterium]
MIAGLFFLAWIIHRLGRRLAPQIMRLIRFTSRRDRHSPERQKTLQYLIASAISILAFIAAILLSLLQFIGPDTLFWIVGLFSAAFGLGARPLISDVLSGMGFLFEDTFSVGEKVEVMGKEGVIEAVNLRTTWMRAPTGELYVIPNGEIRVIRNFSRGRFSSAKIKVKI